jgi:multiple sugar transport system substrate-binding protein
VPGAAEQYPFHALLKAQIANYGLRPPTPAYGDITLAIQKALSPTANINPTTVVNTLRDEVKQALSSQALL